MGRCDVCLEEVDDGVSCAACVDVESRIASATAALRARLERAESDRETLTRLVTATEQRRDEYRDMMYAERGRAERYRAALETIQRWGLSWPPDTNTLRLRDLVDAALSTTEEDGDERTRVD